MKKKVDIKSIIFDIGGVLAIEKKGLFKKRKNKENFSSHKYVSKKLKIPLDQYFDSIDSAYADSIIGVVNKDQLLDLMSRNFHTPRKKIERLYLNAYKRKFKKNKKLYKFALKLKEKGYKIAILSDQWPLSKEALIDKNYYEDFNQVVISSDVGVRKPNPKIYKLILKKLKLKPQETVFIDNRDWNLKSAKKLGMNVILFESNKQLFNELKKHGVDV